MDCDCVISFLFFGPFCLCSYQNTGDSYCAWDIFHLEGCQDRYSSWCTLAIDFWKSKHSSFTLFLLNFFFLAVTYPYSSTSRFWTWFSHLPCHSLPSLCVIPKLDKQHGFHVSLQEKVKQEEKPSCPTSNNLHSDHSYTTVVTLHRDLKNCDRLPTGMTKEDKQRFYGYKILEHED